MAWTPPSYVTSGEASSTQFNEEVVDNLIHLHDKAVPVPWTPTAFGGWTPGNGTWDAHYVWDPDAGLLTLRWVFTVGSTTAFHVSASNNKIQLPVGFTAAGIAAGPAFAQDVSGSLYDGSCFIQESTVVTRVFQTGTQSLSASVPFTWATGDIFTGQLTFKATGP